MVFGKQNTAEIVEKSSSISSRAFHLSINERRPTPAPTQQPPTSLDDSVVSHDNSPTVISKLHPIHPDNMSINLSSRYDISALNRAQTMVRDRFQ